MKKFFTIINNINKIAECLIVFSYFFIERSFYFGRYAC